MGVGVGVGFCGWRGRHQSVRLQSGGGAQTGEGGGTSAGKRWLPRPPARGRVGVGVGPLVGTGDKQLDHRGALVGSTKLQLLFRTRPMLETNTAQRYVHTQDQSLLLIWRDELGVGVGVGVGGLGSDRLSFLMVMPPPGFIWTPQNSQPKHSGWNDLSCTQRYGRRGTAAAGTPGGGGRGAEAEAMREPGVMSADSWRGRQRAAEGHAMACPCRGISS